MPRRFMKPAVKITLLHALVEIAGIIFLFYSNLLMGEFTHSSGAHKTLAAALHNIITRTNATIALITATAGFVVFTYIRMRLHALESTPPTTGT